jgi:hypothetical protein
MRVNAPNADSGGILGIRPWIEHGGFALNRAGQWTFVDMPTVVVKGKRSRLGAGRPPKPKLDLHALFKLVGRLKPDQSFLEADAPHPGEGSRRDAHAYGAIEMALIANGVRYAEVPWPVWKKAVPSTRAKELFKAAGFQPEPGKAEAMLIALYGAEQQQAGAP